MHRYDQLSLLVSLVLLGIALSSIIELPIKPLTLIVLDHPFPLSLSAPQIIALLLVAIVWTGTDSMVRSHPKVRSAGLGYALTFCPLPTLFTSVAFFLVRPLSINRPFWLGGLALIGLLLSLIIIGEWCTIDHNDGVARLGLNLIAYLVALALYIAIYKEERGPLSAVAALAVSGLLALDLLRVGDDELSRPSSNGIPFGPSALSLRRTLEPLRAKPLRRESSSGDTGRTWLCALVAGLAMGEAAWALNYWRISGLRGGMLLLLIFYVITGLAQQGLLGRLTRWVLVEFAIVAVAGLVFLYRYVP